MPTFINTGSTFTVLSLTGLSLGADSAIAPGALLDGAGAVVGGVSLLNHGTIAAADLAGASLDLNVGTLINPGTLRAADGTLTVQPAVAAPALSGTTLTGGVWEATGAGTLDVLTGLIVTDNATITLDGVASAFNDSGGGGDVQALEASLGTVGASGVLNVLGGRDFQTTGAFESDGTTTLGGGMLFALNGVTIASGGVVSGFGDVEPLVQDDGTLLALGGTLSVPDPVSVTGTGGLAAGAGGTLALHASGAYSQSIVNGGTIEAMNTGAAGTLTIGGAAYQGSGAFLIQGGFNGTALTTLDLAGPVSGDVAFDTNYGRLVVESPASYTGTVYGFADTDSIMLKNLGASTASLMGGALALIKNGTTLRTLALDTGAMDYSAASFSVATAGVNDTVVTVSGSQAACYRAGTRISTARGQVRVEDLVPGDRVTARFAGMAPIVWIGRRHVDCRRHPDPARVWPVRVAAHAFGRGLPHSDLWLSPDHAVFAGHALIPIKYLVNGTTIAQIPVRTVTYYHLELPEHDIVLAEGLPAESYLENGDRHTFENSGGLIALHPAFGHWRREGMGCAPLLVTGPALAAARARVAAFSASRQGSGEKRRQGSAFASSAAEGGSRRKTISKYQ